ncbi:MAG TPA: MFS transporter, partial [Thermoanaerobaculia bacterium]|nr:MFS transporter [Thermoanaerobaculia bacterium]
MLSRDARLLFAARIVRLFAYGFVAVVLVLYLSSIGLDDHRIGLLLSLTLAGDVIVSLYLTTRADSLGRRRTLLAGAVLMIGAAVVFALTRDFTLLVLAATIGVISPSGNEVGPFLAVEQVALAH